MFPFTYKPPADVTAVVTQLERLNRNLERYLAMVGAPVLADPSADSGPKTLYVGEPISDLDLALKEHADSLGIQWPPTGE
jgi:hypothetical protein